MNSLFRGLGSGVGRVLGRFIGTIIIVLIIYLLLNAFNIDIKSIIPKLKGLIL